MHFGFCQRTMPANQLIRTSVIWLMKTHVFKRHECNITKTLARYIGHSWTKPAIVYRLVASDNPSNIAVHFFCGCMQRLGGTAARMKPPKPALARLIGNLIEYITMRSY